MTGYRRIFFDTAPIIYYLDEAEVYYDKVTAFFRDHAEAAFFTSVVTTMEYLTGVYRIGDEKNKESMFDGFISDAGFRILESTDEIARKAALIRSKYKAIKGMDALQLASAITSGCDIFLTNDHQLKQVREIAVITVDEL